VAINSDSDRLREFLQAKIAKRKKQIHPEHSARFNHDMRLQIDCIEWVLEKIEVDKVHNDILDSIIRKMIKEDQILTTYGQRLKLFNGFFILYLL
jgi:hypothetical protein